MLSQSGLSKLVPALRSRALRWAVLSTLLPLSPVSVADPLTLSEAIKTAFSENPDIQAARAEIGIAEGERKQAGLIPNPVLSWESEDTRRATRTETVTLSQTLEIGGKRAARVETATFGQSAADLELVRRADALRADVTAAWFATLRAETAVTLAKEAQSLANRGIEVAQGRVRAGKASPVEATRAQVQLVETDLGVRRAETERTNRYRDLYRTLGLADASATPLPSGLSPSPGQPPTRVAIQTAISRSAELQLAQARINQADSALGLERRKRIPDVTVSLGSQYSAEERERVNVVGVSLPLPLFDRNQGNVLAASRRAEQSRDLRNAAELTLRSQASAALDQWSSAAVEVEGFEKEVLPAARQAVQAATRGFELGKFGYLEVLDAQRTLISARGQYLEALARATDGRVALERLVGEVSPNDLTITSSR